MLKECTVPIMDNRAHNGFRYYSLNYSFDDLAPHNGYKPCNTKGMYRSNYLPVYPYGLYYAVWPMDQILMLVVVCSLCLHCSMYSLA